MIYARGVDYNGATPPIGAGINQSDGIIEASATALQS